ncbi:MAG: precorrin-6y C5,15-methyltransferase (decarboxylating) subunit CbiE [Proteobacteria bacterium]|nr:precorrin-6y C5,15-methyltransferase (decarboxylating) subunit CbiE [Pseudomonadota bacterium]
MSAWLSIVGLGEGGLEGLSPPARTLVETAEVLIGGARHLALAGEAAGGAAEMLTWETPLSRTVEAIAAREGRRVTVLATGDPMHYGIGVTLARRFGMGALTIIPAPGAFSLASARLGWPLAEAACVTLHGRPLGLMSLHLAPEAHILVLSEDGTTPAKLAAHLAGLGYGPSAMTVFAHMGGPKEQRWDGTAEDWTVKDIPDLNTVAITCHAAPGTRALSRAPGLPDDVYANDGQLTKREVRAATLSALCPLPGQFLWDIGAGAGSIAIEWLRAAPGAKAVAVERKAARAANIAHNAVALGVPTLKIVTGEAPACLEGLARPDAIFIGGGLSSPGLDLYCWRALAPGGRLVANAVTLEGEAALHDLRKETGGEMTRIAISRATAVGPYESWRPLMPVTQFSVEKPRG